MDEHMEAYERKLFVHNLYHHCLEKLFEGIHSRELLAAGSITLIVAGEFSHGVGHLGLLSVGIFLGVAASHSYGGAHVYRLIGRQVRSHLLYTGWAMNGVRQIERWPSEADPVEHASVSELLKLQRP